MDVDREHREYLKRMIFSSGAQWGHRTPDDILDAIEAAGFVVVPRNDLRALYLLHEATRLIGNIQRTTFEIGRISVASETG